MTDGPDLSVDDGEPEPSGERCSFARDVAEWATRVPADDTELDLETALLGDLPDGTYRCPRVATEPDGRCVFHSGRVDDAAVVEALIEVIESEPDPDAFAVPVESDALYHRWKRILGLSVDVLDLSNDAIDSPTAPPLDLRWLSADRVTLSGSDLASTGLRLDGGEIGTVELDGATLGGDVSCAATTIERDVTVEGATIEGDCRFDASTIGGRVAGENLTVDGTLRFEEIETRGHVRLSGARIDELLYLREATVGGTVDCAAIWIGGNHFKADVTAVQVRGATIDGRLILRKADVDGTLLGNELTVGSDLDLREATFGDEVWLGGYFGDVADLGPAEIGGSLMADGITVGGEFDTRGTKGDGKYGGSTVGGVVALDDGSFGELVLGHTQSSLRLVSARGIETNGGEIEQPADGDRLTFDLTGATLGDVTIDESTSIERDVRFLETTFDAFDFSGDRRLFSRGSWSIHDVESPARVAAGRRYREAAELGRDAAVVAAVERDVADRLVRDADVDAAALADRLFGDRHDVASIAKHGVRTGFHPVIRSRENFRRGFVTYLAERLDGRDRNALDEALDDPACRDHLRAIAYRARRLVERRRVGSDERAAAPDGGTVDVPPEAVEDALTDPYVTRAIHEFAAALSGLLADESTVTPSLDQLEVTYLRARNGADTVGDTVAAAEFYVRELGTRRRQHRARLVDPDEAPLARGRALYDYVSNLLLWVLAGYGERPRHVVLWSIATVGGFAALFWAFAGVRTGFPADGSVYGGPVGHLLLSVESFTTLVHGGSHVEDPLVRLAADVEGFFGAFFVALFVFTLTRSIDR